MHFYTEGLVIETLSGINPDDLRFHACRYTSGACFRDAVLIAKDVQQGEAEVEDLAGAIEAALDGTAEDGGDAGTIPCLGGDALVAWNLAKQWWWERP